LPRPAAKERVKKNEVQVLSFGEGLGEATMMFIREYFITLPKGILKKENEKV